MDNRMYQDYNQKEDIFKLSDYGAQQAKNPLTRMSRHLMFSMRITYPKLKELTIDYVNRKFPPGTAKTHSSTVSNMLGAFIDQKETMSLKTFLRLLDVLRIREATLTLQAIADTSKVYYTQATMDNRDKALDVPFVFKEHHHHSSDDFDDDEE